MDAQNSADESKLTDKQQRFVQEYVKDWNATQAALRAGYAESGAGQEGHRLLKNAEIRAAIDRFLADLGATPERVIAEQVVLAYSDIGDYLQSYEDGKLLPSEQEALRKKTRAIKKIKISKKGVELELYDKQKSLDSLAKILGMVKESPIAAGSDENKSSLESLIEVLGDSK